MGDKKRELENTKEEARLRKQVVKLKEFGKEIEEIQKSRITPGIRSIQRRIRMNANSFSAVAGMIIGDFGLDYNLESLALSKDIQYRIKIYKSIRLDICETLKKKEGK